MPIGHTDIGLDVVDEGRPLLKRAAQQQQMKARVVHGFKGRPRPKGAFGIGCQQGFDVSAYARVTVHRAGGAPGLGKGSNIFGKGTRFLGRRVLEVERLVGSQIESVGGNHESALRTYAPPQRLVDGRRTAFDTAKCEQPGVHGKTHAWSQFQFIEVILESAHIPIRVHDPRSAFSDRP